MAIHDAIAAIKIARRAIGRTFATVEESFAESRDCAGSGLRVVGLTLGLGGLAEISVCGVNFSPVSRALNVSV